MGAAPFALLLAELLAASQVLTVLLAWLVTAAAPAFDAVYSRSCAVGFSGVLFGLKVVLNAHTPDTVRVAGYHVPAKVPSPAACSVHHRALAMLCKTPCTTRLLRHRMQKAAWTRASECSPCTTCSAQPSLPTVAHMRFGRSSVTDGSAVCMLGGAGPHPASHPSSLLHRPPGGNLRWPAACLPRRAARRGLEAVFSHARQPAGCVSGAAPLCRCRKRGGRWTSCPAGRQVRPFQPGIYSCLFGALLCPRHRLLSQHHHPRVHAANCLTAQVVWKAEARLMALSTALHAAGEAANLAAGRALGLACDGPHLGRGAPGDKP